MRRLRHTKIVATLGPSSSSADGIEKLLFAGVDVFRLNFSHGTHEAHLEGFQIIRHYEKKLKQPLGIIVDLQGPKLRIGHFERGNIYLENNQRFYFDLDPSPGNQSRVNFPHSEIYKVLQEGYDLLLNDGKLRLKVTNCQDDQLETTVVTGGELSDRKGVNIPGIVLPVTSLTEKDCIDLEFILSHRPDWIALSFVQRVKDIKDAREIIGSTSRIIAKIEKPQALDCLEEIIALSDAVMVARGDLGVEMSPAEVPPIQKKIIHNCHKAGKPVIIATQMLESMITNPSPTRAEASDVATAVYEGADAVMLSAESASGKYPVLAVDTMDKIIHSVESDPYYHNMLKNLCHEASSVTADAITSAARQIADQISAAAIVTFTASGFTTIRMARERPLCPIIGVTSLVETARKLVLVWGVHTFLMEDLVDMDDMVIKACSIAKQEDFAGDADRIVITAGIPLRTPGKTNLLRIARVRDWARPIRLMCAEED